MQTTLAHMPLDKTLHNAKQIPATMTTIYPSLTYIYEWGKP